MTPTIELVYKLKNDRKKIKFLSSMQRMNRSKMKSIKMDNMNVFNSSLYDNTIYKSLYIKTIHNREILSRLHKEVIETVSLLSQRPYGMANK